MSVPNEDDEPESIGQHLDRIALLSASMAKFWAKAHGWAPSIAADGLSDARLDWIASFSRTLRARVEEVETHPDEPAAIILAWAHLRTLVEGNLKFYLTVFLADYLKDKHASMDKKTGKVRLPKDLRLEDIRHFLKKAGLLPRREAFIERVQSRGNAIHAFSDKPIGTAAEYLEQIPLYRDFLEDIETSFPYPDTSYYA